MWHHNNENELNEFLEFDNNNGNTIITLHDDDEPTITHSIILDGVNLGSEDVIIENGILAVNSSETLFVSDDTAVDNSNLTATLPDEVI